MKNAAGLEWRPVCDGPPEEQGEYLVRYVFGDMVFHKVLYYFPDDSVREKGWHEMDSFSDSITDHEAGMVKWIPIADFYPEKGEFDEEDEDEQNG